MRVSGRSDPPCEVVEFAHGQCVWQPVQHGGSWRLTPTGGHAQALRWYQRRGAGLRTVTSTCEEALMPILQRGALPRQPAPAARAATVRLGRVQGPARRARGAGPPALAVRGTALPDPDHQTGPEARGGRQPARLRRAATRRPGGGARCGCASCGSCAGGRPTIRGAAPTTWWCERCAGGRLGPPAVEPSARGTGALRFRWFPIVGDAAARPLQTVTP